jgi:hypothetical protein
MGAGGANTYETAGENIDGCLFIFNQKIPRIPPAWWDEEDWPSNPPLPFVMSPAENIGIGKIPDDGDWHNFKLNIRGNAQILGRVGSQDHPGHFGGFTLFDSGVFVGGGLEKALSEYEPGGEEFTSDVTVIFPGYISHHEWEYWNQQLQESWIISMHDDFTIYRDGGYEVMRVDPWAGETVFYGDTTHFAEGPLCCHEDIYAREDIYADQNIYVDGGISVNNSMDIHNGGLNVYGGDLYADHDLHVSGRLFVRGVEIHP